MSTFKEISLEGWGRRAHYEFFMENFQFPHSSITAPVEVTRLVQFCHDKKYSLFHTSVYLIAKSMNEVLEFKQRIRPGKVIQWDKVNPSYTVMGEDNQFLFCDVDFSDDLKNFHDRSVEMSRKLKEEKFQTDLHKDDNRLFLSCLPWISFTQMSHPIHSAKFDATPRISWGKITDSDSRKFMPLNIQAHHALVDGHHFGLAFKQFEKNVNML